MLGVETLVTRPKEDMREQSQNLIGPVAAKYPFGKESEPARDGFPQRAPRAIGINR